MSRFLTISLCLNGKSFIRKELKPNDHPFLFFLALPPLPPFFYTSTKLWRGYIFTAVCLCVCLFVCVSVMFSCEQNSSRTDVPIWTRFLLYGCLPLWLKSNWNWWPWVKGHRHAGVCILWMLLILHLHKIVDGLYLHCSLSVCVSVCLSLCLSVCPTLLVNQSPAKRMHRFRRSYREMAA